jgi:hypothetical protein
MSNSCVASSCAVTRETYKSSKNPKVHYHAHKSPPLVHNQSQINPDNTIPFYLSRIHINTIQSIMPWSSQWSLFFWLFHQKDTCILLLPIYATLPAHLIPIDLIILIILSEEYNLWNSHYAVFFNLLSPHPSSVLILLCTLFWNSFSLYSFLNVRDQIVHPYRIADKIIVLYILILTLADSKTKATGLNGSIIRGRSLNFLINHILICNCRSQIF